MMILRPAARRDARLLFDWVNRSDSLVAKRRTNRPIRSSDHDAWFEMAIDDPDCRIWIVERGGIPVGQVRLQGSAMCPEIDVYVVAEARGQGLARYAVAEAIRSWRRSHPAARPRAWVRAGNEASLALFRALGFERSAESDDFVCFEQTAP